MEKQEQKFELIISTESKVLACNIADFEKQADQFLATLTSKFETDDDFAAAKEEVKTSLRPGEYCVYDNKDGTYTLMLKWWDMDDPNGIKYDDIPQIKSAGGVGSYLKDKFPEIYGSLSQNTINKINDVYRNKALQNVRIYFNSKYIKKQR